MGFKRVKIIKGKTYLFIDSYRNLKNAEFDSKEWNKNKYLTEIIEGFRTIAKVKHKYYKLYIRYNGKKDTNEERAWLRELNLFRNEYVSTNYKLSERK